MMSSDESMCTYGLWRVRPATSTDVAGADGPVGLVLERLPQRIVKGQIVVDGDDVVYPSPSSSSEEEEVVTSTTE